MKKLALLAAVLMIIPASVMAGMTAFDNMTELGSEMEEITGQVGISIDQSLDLSIGYLAWTDSDGFGTTVTANQGVLTLDTITVDNNGSPMTIVGMKIDAGSDGTTSYLAIESPTITGQVTIDAIRIGTNADLGGSLGALTISNLVMQGSTTKIYAH